MHGICRAAKTLLYYFFELNPTLYGWLSMYLKEHEIPRDGSWDDVSGETFLREMLMTPIEETRWGQQVVRLRSNYTRIDFIACKSCSLCGVVIIVLDYDYNQ